MKAVGSNVMLVRRDWNQSVRGQCKGPISGQGALVGATPMTQSRGFSLPWYRLVNLNLMIWYFVTALKLKLYGDEYFCLMSLSKDYSTFLNVY